VNLSLNRIAIALAPWGVFCALASTGNAHAAETSITVPAAICKPLGRQTAVKLEALSYSTSGVSNEGTSAQSVVCPLPRPAQSGQTVYVDGRVYVGKYLSCSVSSFNDDGSFRGAKVFTAPNAVTQTFDTPLTFSEAEAPYWAYLGAQCSLPVYGGSLFGFGMS
jgi:hypothetical protein